MLSYDWPGNVRELENFIESSVLYAPRDKTMLEGSEVNNLNNRNNNIRIESKPTKTKSINSILESMELKLIMEALLNSGGNVTKAAKYLEIPRQTLQQKMIKFKISSIKKRNSP